MIGVGAKPTIRDVAARAGVSVATVSRVFNNKEGVGGDVRRRVLALADEMGYQPSPSARRLAEGRSDSLGFLVRYHRVLHAQDPFYSSILYAAEAVACRHGFHVVPLLVGESPLEQLQREISAGRFAGFLAAGPEVPDSLLETIRNRSTPLVLVDNRPDAGSGPPAVSSDDQAGARLVVEHLLAHGYTDLACFTGPLSWPSSRDRYSGYAVAVQAHQARGGDRVVSVGETTAASGYEAFQRLWRASGGRAGLPQALFCVNDAMALGASRAAREKGLHLPEELAVVGFDDVPMAAEARPALTTVHIDTERIGSLAAEQLLRQLESGRVESTFTLVLVPVELVVRASCGCSVAQRETVGTPAGARSGGWQGRSVH